MQQSSKKGLQVEARLGVKGDPLGSVQEIQIWTTIKWYIQKPESILDNERHKILWNFLMQTDCLIPVRKPDLVLIYKKIKKSEKIDIHLDIARELKHGGTKVMGIPIIVGVFGMIPKGLKKKWRNLKSEEESRPSRLQHCWDRPAYSEESWKSEKTCCHTYYSERSSANAGAKNALEVK